MCREGMNPLEFKNLSDTITTLEKQGWSIVPYSDDMVELTPPKIWIKRLGLIPNYKESFGTLWNAVCWAKGFTAAMRYGE
jgi:hypothetical protein